MMGFSAAFIFGFNFACSEKVFDRPDAPSPLVHCGFVGFVNTCIISVYMVVYVGPRWHELVYSTVADLDNGYFLSVGVFMSLALTMIVLNFSFFWVAGHGSAIHLGLAKAVQIAVTFFASSALFCSSESKQQIANCIDYPNAWAKPTSVLLIVVGVCLYSSCGSRSKRRTRARSTGATALASSGSRLRLAGMGGAARTDPTRTDPGRGEAEGDGGACDLTLRPPAGLPLGRAVAAGCVWRGEGPLPAAGGAAAASERSKFERQAPPHVGVAVRADPGSGDARAKREPPSFRGTQESMAKRMLEGMMQDAGIDLAAVEEAEEAEGRGASGGIFAENDAAAAPAAALALPPPFFACSPRSMAKINRYRLNYLQFRAGMPFGCRGETTDVLQSRGRHGAHLQGWALDAFFARPQDIADECQFMP
jgi:hypothetical protein